MRALRAVAIALGLAATFVAAFAIGVLAHLDLPPVRRAIASRVTGALADTFAGRLAIERIDRASLREIGGVRVRVDDPEGRPVVVADGLRARVRTAVLVESLFGGGPIAIEVDDVRADAIDLRLDADATGALDLVRAFASRRPSPPSTTPSRGVRLSLARVAIAHAWVHGTPAAGAPSIDADLDALEGSVLVAPSQVAIDVTKLSLAARGLPHPVSAARGDVAVRLDLPSPKSAALGARAAWKGSIAGIDETIDAAIDGDAVDVTLDAPVMPPDAIRALWPASPIDRAASLHAEAHGALPTLEVRVRSGLEGASLDVAGPITIGADTTARLAIDARAIDAHSVAAGAPTSRLDAKGDVTIARHADGAIDATAGIDFAGGPVGARHAPAARIDATFARDARGAMRGDATVVSRDPAMPARIEARLAPKGRSFAVAFDARAEAPRLDGIAWLGPIAQGRARVASKGTVDVERGAITAHAEAEANDLARGDARAGHASIVLDARGPLHAPTIDATIRGESLAAAGRRVDVARLEVHGPPTHAHVALALHGGDLPDIEAETDVAITQATSLHDVEVRVRHAGEHVHARVDEVKIARDKLVVEGAELEGLGAPAHLSLQASRESLRLVARARHLDLARLARLAGRDLRVREGRVAVDADVAIDKQGASGRVAMELASVKVDALEDLGAKLDATLDGRRVQGSLHAELGAAGALDVTTAGLEIGGTGPVLGSWRRAWGRLVIEAHVALAKATAVLPKGTLPFDASGDVTIHGRAWRDSMTDETLGLLLEAKTSGLMLAGRPREPGTPPPWIFEGVDLALDSRVDGDTGFAEVAVRANDAKGELAQIDLKADTIPYAKMIGDPDARLAALRAIAFNAQVLVPRRDVDDLPSLLAVEGADGLLEAKVDVQGPLDRLAVQAKGSVSRARLDSSGLSAPLDLAFDGDYDGERATAKLVASMHQRAVLEAGAVLHAKMSDVLDAHGGEIPWRSAARAHLASFPLESIGALSDHQIKGQVTGELAIQGLHRDGRAGMILDLKALTVGDVAFPQGVVRATIDDDALDVSAHLVQEDGALDVKAHAGANWKAAMIPVLDPGEPLEASITAKRFRAAALLPLVENQFTELDARIDADAKAVLDPRTRTAKLSGTITATQGRFELAAVGGEFHDATATIRFTPDGVVTLENARAYGMSGRVEAAASARFDSRGLVGAAANVVIPRSSALLLSVEGAQVGTVDGNVAISAAATPDRKELDVAVDVKRLHVQLPLQSERDVQLLGPIPGVRIGRAKQGAGFVAVTLDPQKAQTLRAADATRVVITVDLGRDLTVQRTGSLTATLEGRPKITIARTTEVTGQIRILNGKIDVQGKLFDVDEGTVTFVGDASNPQVVLTASFQAEDGTKVYADFVGPLKTGKVTLRSEPTLSQSQILSLLVFGTSDSTAGSASDSGSENSAYKAAGVAGGAATQPVNRALQQFGLGGVSTRVDTSGSTTRPEVEVAIARNISVQLAVVLGTPPPGANLDTTLLTVDWRFARAWSLATTVGDAGTSIFDLLWHYRY